MDKLDTILGNAISQSDANNQIIAGESYITIGQLEEILLVVRAIDTLPKEGDELQEKT